MIECKICKEQFVNDKSFHAHLKKHGMYQGEYYCKYYPRLSLYYKKPIPFVNKIKYFNTEFINFDEFLEWDKNENQEIVKQKYIEILQKRMKAKDYLFAPFYNELKSLNLPTIDLFKKHCGSYNSVCKILDKEPLFNKPLPKDFSKVYLKNEMILVDTREQDPLEFPNTKIEKLFVGDYLMNAQEYNYTFIDRKSENDFLGTLASGVDRFEREVQRTVELEGYLFVVIETTIDSIINNHKKFKRKTNLEYVFHNLRNLTHKYPRHLQFIFTGSRKKSIDLIPRLLYFGKDLWQVDLQYFLDHELGNR